MDTRTWMRYWRRAVWVAALLRYVPFVRLVGLNGSMATGTFEATSDIDLYIVTADGHIFLTRILTTGMITLLGLKKSARHHAGKICPNRFAVESYVEITPHDTYHARVFHNLIPLYAARGVYERYCSENTWMARAGFPPVNHPSVLKQSPFAGGIQWFGERLLASRWFEQRAERWQRGRIARDPKAGEAGSRVMVSARELRFHTVKEVHG